MWDPQSYTHFFFFFLLLSRAIIDQHPHKNDSQTQNDNPTELRLSPTVCRTGAREEKRHRVVDEVCEPICFGSLKTTVVFIVRIIFSFFIFLFVLILFTPFSFSFSCCFCLVTGNDGLREKETDCVHV